MNIRQLEVFKAVMDCGSATAAATALSLSQPAVSQHLAQLEASTGLMLFLRDRGRLVATDQALTLYTEVAHAFEGFERVFNLAQTIRSDTGGHLRIACPFSFSDGLMPRLIARFTERHPKVRFSLELGGYPAIVGMVAARAVDLGIAKGPITHPGVLTRPLTKSLAVCALPRGHRLARRERLAIAEIADEPLIMLGRHKPWRHEVDQIFRLRGRRPNIRVETHSVAAACSFVAAGVGVTIVPRTLGALFADRGIVLRDIDIRIEHDFQIVLPSALAPSTIVEQFAATITEAVCALQAAEPAERHELEPA